MCFSFFEFNSVFLSYISLTLLSYTFKCDAQAAYLSYMNTNALLLMLCTKLERKQPKILFDKNLEQVSPFFWLYFFEIYQGKARKIL